MPLGTKDTRAAQRGVNQYEDGWSMLEVRLGVTRNLASHFNEKECANVTVFYFIYKDKEHNLSKVTTTSLLYWCVFFSKYSWKHIL